MKIYCVCGATIYDQTDAISYKAAFVADQDRFDLLEALEHHIDALTAAIKDTSNKKTTDAIVERTKFGLYETIRTYVNRMMYQCTACGRLYVDDASYASQVFDPSEPTIPTNLLRSIRGDAWKRPLRGRWNSAKNQGELWWGFGDAEEGFEQFDDYDKLKRRYFEVFARLRARDIVRDALLRNGDQIIHQWP